MLSEPSEGIKKAIFKLLSLNTAYASLFIFLHQIDVLSIWFKPFILRLRLEYVVDIQGIAAVEGGAFMAAFFFAFNAIISKKKQESKTKCINPEKGAKKQPQG